MCAIQAVLAPSLFRKSALGTLRIRESEYDAGRPRKNNRVPYASGVPGPPIEGFEDFYDSARDGEAYRGVANRQVGFVRSESADTF
jgi:hypothetical protein